MTYNIKSGDLYFISPFESEALSRSPRQPSMESGIWRLEKFKLASNGNITNKIYYKVGHIDLSVKFYLDLNYTISF